MDRFVLTDAQWAKMEPHCLGKAPDPGWSGGDNRLFQEAVLWIARTGSPWRDLPPLFGKWNTVFKRYRDWVEADVFKRIFDAASDDPDMEFAMVDVEPSMRHRSEHRWRGIVKVHRPPFRRLKAIACRATGQGAKGGPKIRPSASQKAE